MKKMLMLTLALLVIASGAMAKAPLEKPLVPYQGNARAIEVEPNNDHSTANAWAGDDMLGYIDAGDLDYFAFAALGGSIWDFQTNPVDGGTNLDSKLYVYDVDGVTQLAFNDDGGGQGFYSLIEEFEFPADGTYFIAVTGYSGSSTGDYILTATEFIYVEPPENDTCDGAINLDDFGVGGGFSIDLCLYEDDYSPSGAVPSCTGYGANGMDAVYYVVLPEGGSLNVTMTGNSVDASLYLITDCDDPNGSCVIGSDSTYSSPNIEEFNYTDAPAGIYYLIVDAYSGCGLVDVVINGMVATENVDFGTVKSLY